MQPPAAAPAPTPLPVSQQRKGPTGYSNWVFPDLLLVGAHPYGVDDLDAIVRQNVRLFVCLETPQELERHKSNYFDRLKQTIAKAPKKYPQGAAEIEFLHFPIFDRSVADDAAVLNLVARLRREMQAGRRIFMHCRGGHGRTGTIVSLILAHHYSITAHEALELCQGYHDTREDVLEAGLGYYTSPETAEQRNQVYRLAEKRA